MLAAAGERCHKKQSYPELQLESQQTRPLVTVTGKSEALTTQNIVTTSDRSGI